MGYIVSATGVRLPPERVHAILEYPLPESAHGLRHLLGMFDFYRRFIKHASELEASLHKRSEQTTPKRITTYHLAFGISKLFLSLQR